MFNLLIKGNKKITDFFLRAIMIDKSPKGKLMSIVIKQWLKTNQKNSGKEIGEILIDNGANVDAVDEDGVTPLFNAVALGNL